MWRNNVEIRGAVVMMVIKVVVVVAALPSSMKCGRPWKPTRGLFLL